MKRPKLTFEDLTTAVLVLIVGSFVGYAWAMVYGIKVYIWGGNWQIFAVSALIPSIILSWLGVLMRDHQEDREVREEGWEW